MSFAVAELQGVQRPRVEVVPDFALSHADDAGFFASAYRLTPDEWQAHVLEAWLAEAKGGKWAASRVGLSVARQNGKNAILEVRELFGMVALGEKFLHTAHEVKTARKAFLRLASFFENEREWPELARLVQSIRKTNGQEAIILTNGGSCEFVARSKGSGRGFTVDVLVLDEAQDLTDEQYEALKPTISSAPLRNPQTVLTGTPPPPDTKAEVFERFRTNALEGARRLAWHEWSVEDPDDVDMDDPEVWASTNPALGVRLNLDVVADERADMSDEGFARERLGSWKRAGAQSVIDPAAWSACRDIDSRPSDPVAFAIDTTPDRARTSIAMAGKAGEFTHVELVDNHSGTQWVVGRVLELRGKWSPCAVALDPAGPAGSLVEPLREAGVDVLQLSGRQLTQACGGFYDDAMERRLRHIDQPELDVAIAAAKRRPLGDAWAWHRKDSTDISPLVAVTLARFALLAAYEAPMAEPDIVLL